MFMQRHIFVHNEGKVDSKYLKITEDTAVRDGQIIRGNKTDLSKFIELILAVAKQLFEKIQEKNK
jgi:hypothetical protein